MLDLIPKQIALALACPFFIYEGCFTKVDSDFDEITKNNLVTRASTDSLRRHIVLKVLDEILSISSVEDFWDKKYKIWNLEINSYEDLQQNREKLENMRESWENYDIPWFKEAVKYAAEKGISTTFYS